MYRFPFLFFPLTLVKVGTAEKQKAKKTHRGSRKKWEFLVAALWLQLPWGKARKQRLPLSSFLFFWSISRTSSKGIGFWKTGKFEASNWPAAEIFFSSYPLIVDLSVCVFLQPPNQPNTPGLLFPAPQNIRCFVRKVAPVHVLHPREMSLDAF